jgi:nucleobase:cation symporter-1, NCS1 family
MAGGMQGPGHPRTGILTSVEGVEGSGPTGEGEFSIETRGIISVPPDARYGRPYRLFTLWFAPQITPVTFFIGALGPAFGLSFWQSFWIIIIANLIATIPLGILSTWGPSTGMAQLPLSRTAYGKSVALPAMLNWATCILWQGFDNVFGVTALHLLLHVPLWSGVLLVLGGQLLLGIVGYEAVHLFQKYMTIVLAIIFAILTIKIIASGGTTHVAATLTGASLVGAGALLFVGVGSYTYSWVTYAADYSRYLPANTPRYKTLLYPVLGCGLSAIWMELLGLAVAHQILSGGIYGASATVRNLMGGGFVGGLTLLAIYLGIVGVNSLDDYTGSLSLQTAGIRLIRPATAGITAVLAFIVSMWFIYGGEQLAGKAQNFLLFIGYWITAWLGVVAVDWVRRRGRVDVRALDQYTLRRGGVTMHAGIPALVAMVVGFIAALPVSDTTIGYNFVTGHPHSPLRYLVGEFSIVDLHGADLGFVAGFIVSAVVYVLLDRKTGGRVPFLGPSPAPAAAKAGAGSDSDVTA